MRSGVIHLTSGAPSAAALAADGRRCLAEGAERPDVVCAFLPPGPTLQATIDAMAEAWPDSIRLGCEAVTQFADGEMTGTGSLQLLSFEHPEHSVEVTVIRGSMETPPADEDVERVAEILEADVSVFVLADGLRFPAEDFLWRLGKRLEARAAARPPSSTGQVVGGLASQREPISSLGARVFLDREIYEYACLVIALPGVDMEVEIVRGWDPASPIYTVTAAEGNALREIDGEPAADWFRRFFTVEGELAPLPESAYRFPLVLDGPGAERRGIYRSMKTFDDPPGTVTFWGELKVGDHIRLCMGNDRSLLRTAARLPQSAPAEAAFLYSCVGREAVLGELASREVGTIHEALGGASLAGFFTFGEIGPSGGIGPAFYNHTAVLALLRERTP